MAATAYDRLLTGIALGDYAPGSALNEKKLAAQLGVSRTPVREALLRHGSTGADIKRRASR